MIYLRLLIEKNQEKVYFKQKVIATLEINLF